MKNKMYDRILKETGSEREAQAYIDRLNAIPGSIDMLPVPYQIYWKHIYGKTKSKKLAWDAVKKRCYKSENGEWKMKKIGTSKSPGYFKANFFGKIAKEDDGFWYMSGKASDSSIDLEDDRMAPEFIQKMIATAEGLTLFVDHQYDLNSGIGTIVESWGDPNNFYIKAKLEEPYDPDTKKGSEMVSKLISKSEAGIRTAFSIGGRITKAIKAHSSEVGRTIRTIYDGILAEVSATLMPANTSSTAQVSFGKAISKALDEMEGEGMLESSASKISLTLSKVLDEAMEAEELWSAMYELTWTYNSLIRQIAFNDEMDGPKKKAKIQELSGEFADKIEDITSKMADAVIAQIEFMAA